jgi:hypothetical protein
MRPAPEVVLVPSDKLMLTTAAISGNVVVGVEVAGEPPTTPRKSVALSVLALLYTGLVKLPKLG